MYATDEFRMFSFKVRPCSRAYSHDWTECPFVHPGENARRRDPRKYHYSCVPCPDFRKGACRRADMCEYAHGVFECWLHPAQYRTRLCKDGTSCTRRVCFFAHTGEELRPLYVSTGSAVPSPRTSASPAVDITTMGLVPGSPSSLSALVSPFTPPMSPSANGMSHSSGNCPQPSVPALHLPGSNLQSSRLRSALSARDVQDFENHQLINDLCISRLGSSAGNRTSRSKNLDELFSAEITSSPRYNSEQGGIFSPSRKISVPSHSSLLQASLGVSSPGRMSPRSIDPVSPLGSHLSAFALRERQSLRSLSARDLGAGSFFSPGSSWYKWSSPSGTLEWGLDGEELRRSSSFDLRLDEPDVSWVHSLVKESAAEKSAVVGSSSMAQAGIAGQKESHDHAAALMAWLEQMQLDQMVA
ncbi:hypothetical protein HPP92_009581 [Vanilla planifolia]|uniref:C3H1-type domain-containing protein n=1 Tax=Vanilla planifolia TaxID=51239 RepID=A0A835RGG4_VANPL|nr:hypothetical protein HPP92_009581 [Vanilla planifolia]